MKLKFIIIFSILFLTSFLYAAQEEDEGEGLLRLFFLKNPMREVTFINNNPTDTMIGLARFTKMVDGEFTDYEILNIRSNEKEFAAHLTPGTYCATQFFMHKNQIVSFKMFIIKIDKPDKPLKIVFPKLNLKK